MPENLRVLVVILVLATGFFALAHRSASAIAGEGDFVRRRNLWFALTLAAFLAHNFWLYVLIAMLLLLIANRRENNPPALFFFLLFVLPMAIVPIPGMGLIKQLFGLSHARLLELVILLPAFFMLRKQAGSIPFGRVWPDRILAAYLLLTALLHLREPSLTDTLRQAFYLFIDVFLPYYVISRALKNLQDFRDALLSFVLAVMVLAPLAVFETAKHWLLFPSLSVALQLEGGMTEYLGRDEMLRAITTAGHPIALGYLMVVGLGLYLFVRHAGESRLMSRLGMGLLLAGMIAPLSRGPWVGAAVLLLVFVLSGRYAARHWINMSLAALLVFPLLTIMPGGERVINLLPFVGNTEKENVQYRERLITNSLAVIQRNLWLGSNDYLETPEMQAMRQGQGIIDIVNTYILIALNAGVVGLALFGGFFAATLRGVYRGMRGVAERDSEEYLLGRVLLATLLSILVMIFTVSSITIIPIVYWSVAALGVAYAQMVRQRTATQ